MPGEFGLARSLLLCHFDPTLSSPDAAAPFLRRKDTAAALSVDMSIMFNAMLAGCDVG